LGIRVILIKKATGLLLLSAGNPRAAKDDSSLVFQVDPARNERTPVLSLCLKVDQGIPGTR
jgi:hypothetical protein